MWGAGLRNALNDGYGLFESLLALIVIAVIFYAAFAFSVKNEKIRYYVFETPKLYFYPITLGSLMFFLYLLNKIPEVNLVVDDILENVLGILMCSIMLAVFMRGYFDVFIKDP